MATGTVSRRHGFDLTDARLTVVCAWCGKCLQPGGPLISHGMCAGCADSFVSNALVST
ncbi:MAG: hypothetical protein HYX53_12570 [Chloroflexi bacterium]|nr:hypothetical protein [Chloroflexota bacterium]